MSTCDCLPLFISSNISQVSPKCKFQRSQEDRFLPILPEPAYKRRVYLDIPLLPSLLLWKVNLTLSYVARKDHALLSITRPVLNDSSHPSPTFSWLSRFAMSSTFQSPVRIPIPKFASLQFLLPLALSLLPFVLYTFVPVFRRSVYLLTYFTLYHYFK